MLIGISNVYNWVRGKEFNAAQAMRACGRGSVAPDTMPKQKECSEIAAVVSENISMIVSQIVSHPEVRYKILFPPYSMLWWDCAYLNGELELERMDGFFALYMLE